MTLGPVGQTDNQVIDGERIHLGTHFNQFKSTRTPFFHISKEMRLKVVFCIEKIEIGLNKYNTTPGF